MREALLEVKAEFVEILHRLAPVVMDGAKIENVKYSTQEKLDLMRRWLHLEISSGVTNVTVKDVNDWQFRDTDANIYDVNVAAYHRFEDMKKEGK